MMQRKTLATRRDLTHREDGDDQREREHKDVNEDGVADDGGDNEEDEVEESRVLEGEDHGLKKIVKIYLKYLEISPEKKRM